MLRKLEQSPLVRKKLPNTAAVMQQYFNYRRNPGESISSYLVRETLFYEEFIEALQDLHDGGAGAFLLDDILGEGEDEDDDDGETSHGAQQRARSQASLATLRYLKQILTNLATDLVMIDLELDSLGNYIVYVGFNRLLHPQDLAWLATVEWSSAQWRRMEVNFGQYQQPAEL